MDISEENVICYGNMKGLIFLPFQSMFSMDPANLSSEFHEKAVAFVNDSFTALQSLQIPFTQVR